MKKVLEENRLPGALFPVQFLDLLREVGEGDPIGGRRLHALCCQRLRVQEQSEIGTVNRSIEFVGAILVAVHSSGPTSQINVRNE